MFALRNSASKLISTITANNVVAANTIAVRIATRSFSAEPNYMVKTDEYADPKLVKVPYLRDELRQEIYSRHISNPTEWTVSRLSQHYNASLDRTKAVILLMHKRYEMMRAKGFEVTLKPSTSADSAPSIVVEIPTLWTALYEKYKEDPTKEPSKVLSEYNESCALESARTSINAEECGKIIDNLKDHYRRLDNMKARAEKMARYLEKLKNKGVNVYNFQETATFVTSGKGNFKENYYPEMISDEGFDEHKERLLKRISAETKAHVEFNLEHYVKKQETQTVSIPTQNANAPKANGRWKLAFKDLSKDDNSTVIRTRTGR
jgi:hypothetical protein